MSVTVERPVLRKDAERNRQLLLGAAREVFAERGVEASLEEVARRADVGIGTLYRRFPTRAALIEALFEDKAAEYLRLSEEALAQEDVWEAFAGCVERLCEMQADDSAFAEVLTASFPSAPNLKTNIDQARNNVEKLVDRARREGELRRDFDAADIFWIMIANGAYVEATRGIAPQAWRRYLALILDGVRAREARKLPAAPTPEQIVEAVNRLGCRCGGS